MKVGLKTDATNISIRRSHNYGVSVNIYPTEGIVVVFCLPYELLTFACSDVGSLFPNVKQKTAPDIADTCTTAPHVLALFVMSQTQTARRIMTVPMAVFSQLACPFLTEQMANEVKICRESDF